MLVAFYRLIGETEKGEMIMETKENKKNWILSGVILVLFMVTQYMLRTKMFIYSDDVVAQERMLTMNH